MRHSVLITIAGEQPDQVFKPFGIQVANKAANTAIKSTLIAVDREVNKPVGLMLLAKYGTKRSVLTTVKFVPAIGVVVGGSIDAAFTKAVSTAAQRVFYVAPPLGAPTVVFVDA